VVIDQGISDEEMIKFVVEEEVQKKALENSDFEHRFRTVCAVGDTASYIFLVTFSVLYYVTDSFSLLYLLVFSDTL